MARPQATTLFKVGNGTAIPMDINKNPFNVSIFVEVTGTCTYRVEATADNVQNTAVTPVWIKHSTLNSQTTSQASNYAFPVTAIRAVLQTGSTGSIVMTLIQAGIAGS